MKKLLIIFLLLSFSMGVGNGLYWLKDGFSSRRIQSLPYPVEEDWNDEAKEALKQTFTYIGRGRQCFAFGSEDGKYVLKFPRTDIYKTPLWAQFLPVHTYRARIEKDHKKRENFVLNSFRISFKELKEQTALLATHIGQSSSKQFLHIVDAAGCKHELPVATTSFVLQYKRPILMKAFSQAIEKGERKEAEKILDAMLAAINERASKGILNRDRSFLRNYGYDGEKAYQIDVGSFYRVPDMPLENAREKSIRDSVDPVQEWLAKKHPEMLPYLNAHLEALICNK
ncbi:MAG: hypothetical protein K1X28_04235 [Parachlamydiales bacterium]|nr:hypothetical protein [Parachlamydiales bacterium]